METITLDVMEIQELIPQRYPFLMLDRVLELTPGKTLTALKNLTINEQFFTGHFPEKPIMPGVLIAEAIAQASSVLMAYGKEKVEGEVNVIGMIKKMHFKESAFPGDQLKIEIQLVRAVGKTGIVQGTVKVDEREIASGEFIFSTQGGSN